MANGSALLNPVAAGRGFHPIVSPGVATAAAPPVSAVNSATIYYDLTLQKYRVSENGGVYENLVSAGVTTFDGLTDTPNSKITGNALYRLNAGATAIEEAPLILTAAALHPAVNGALTLGIQSTNEWSHLFFAPGSVISWDNNNINLQQSANLLTLNGGNLAIRRDFDGLVNYSIRNDVLGSVAMTGLDLQIGGISQTTALFRLASPSFIATSLFTKNSLLIRLATTDGVVAANINSIIDSGSNNGKFAWYKDDLNGELMQLDIATGALRIGATAGTGSELLRVADGAKASAGEQARFNLNTDESNQLEMSFRVMGDATAADRFCAIQSIEQGVANRALKLNPAGGVVAVGDALQLDDGTTTVDGAVQFDRTNEDLSVGDGTNSKIVHMGEWKTWTPVFTGFSVAPTVNSARFIEIGNLVIARLNINNGTSNATTFTVTLPTGADGDSKQFFVAAITTDNGIAGTTPGLLKTRTGSVTADLYTDTASAGWVASGSKKANWTIMYERN